MLLVMLLNACTRPDRVTSKVCLEDDGEEKTPEVN